MFVDLLQEEGCFAVDVKNNVTVKNYFNFPGATWMGKSNSKLSLLSEQLQGNQRFFGLENFGNTCYFNSVLQALFFCEPFRVSLLNYRLGTREVDAEAQERRRGLRG
jgi:ubiquitin C-terminal hydrolase